jgi:hypothetical protein
MTHKGPQQVYDDYKRVALELRTAEARIEEQDERIEELEAACEVVSSEFEGDLWVVCRRLLTKTYFDFSASTADGVYADDFEGHMNETLAEFDRSQDQLDKLKVIFRGSRHQHHTQSCVKGEIPNTQIKILTDIDMQRVEKALKETP